MIDKAEKIVTKLDAPTFTVDDFGSGTDPFSFEGSSWVMTDQDSNTTISSQATADNDGEYVVASVKTYGEKTDISANYESKVNTAITTSLTVNSVTDLAIDGLTINCAQGSKAKASIKGHKHGSGGHIAKARTVVVPEFLGWGGSQFGLETGIDLSCVQSSSYDVAIGHSDQTDNNGDHLVGIGHGEQHTVKIDYVSDTAPVAIAGWKMTALPDEGKRSNSGFVSGSVTYTKYVAYSA